jgi:hypothetical protein
MALIAGSVWMLQSRPGVGTSARVSMSFSQAVQPLFDRSQLRFRERDLLPQPKKVGVGLQNLGSRGLFGNLERTLRARHTVETLIKEVVGAVSVAPIEDLPGFLCSQPLPNDVLVDQHFDRSDIPSKVACLLKDFVSFVGLIFA